MSKDAGVDYVMARLKRMSLERIDFVEFVDGGPNLVWTDFERPGLFSGKSKSHLHASISPEDDRSAKTRTTVSLDELERKLSNGSLNHFLGEDHYRALWERMARQPEFVESLIEIQPLQQRVQRVVMDRRPDKGSALMIAVLRALPDMSTDTKERLTGLEDEALVQLANTIHERIQDGQPSIDEMIDLTTKQHSPIA